jgi:hypothetical protein
MGAAASGLTGTHHTRNRCNRFRIARELKNSAMAVKSRCSFCSPRQSKPPDEQMVSGPTRRQQASRMAGSRGTHDA